MRKYISMIAVLAAFALMSFSPKEDNIKADNSVTEQINFMEASQVIQNANQINLMGGMYGWFTIDGKVEQRFVKKEHLKLYSRILVHLPSEGRSIKDRVKRGVMEAVDLSGGGNNPCGDRPATPQGGTHYYYNTNNGRYYCCYQFGCVEAPPPYAPCGNC